MVALREYVLSVSAAAVLCGIVCGLAGEKSFSGPVIKLVCGLILTLAVLRPLVNLRLDNLSYGLDSIRKDGVLEAQEGVDYANQAMRRLIKEKTAAYILDKAGRFGAAVQVEIGLTDDTIPIPIHVTVSGNISPYAKEQLKEYIESDLGIPRENQQWIN